MPSANSSRSSGGWRLASIAASRLRIDVSPQPSRWRRSRASPQPEDVGGRVDQAVGEEILDRLGAEPLDVERGAGDEVAQPLDPLGRADQAAGAADVDFAVLATAAEPQAGHSLG
jgi:hypothetical protein